MTAMCLKDTGYNLHLIIYGIVVGGVSPIALEILKTFLSKI